MAISHFLLLVCILSLVVGLAGAQKGVLDFSMPNPVTNCKTDFYLVSFGWYLSYIRWWKIYTQIRLLYSQPISHVLAQLFREYVRMFTPSSTVIGANLSGPHTTEWITLSAACHLNTVLRTSLQYINVAHWYVSMLYLSAWNSENDYIM